MWVRRLSEQRMSKNSGQHEMMNLSKQVDRMPFRPLVVGLLLFEGAIALMAQVTASVTGTVEDASGAGVPEAILTVTSLETGTARVVISDETGYYRVLSL